MKLKQLVQPSAVSTFNGSGSRFPSGRKKEILELKFGGLFMFRMDPSVLV
jgi:hypothetical protein